MYYQNNLTIKGLEESTKNKLTDIAKENGMSRNRFIITQLEAIADSKEVRNLENKYIAVMKILSKQIEANTQLLLDVKNLLEEQKNETKKNI